MFSGGEVDCYSVCLFDSRLNKPDVTQAKILDGTIKIGKKQLSGSAEHFMVTTIRVPVAQI